MLPPQRQQHNDAHNERRHRHARHTAALAPEPAAPPLPKGSVPPITSGACGAPRQIELRGQLREAAADLLRQVLKVPVDIAARSGASQVI